MKLYKAMKPKAHIEYRKRDDGAHDVRIVIHRKNRDTVANERVTKDLINYIDSATTSYNLEGIQKYWNTYN